MGAIYLYGWYSRYAPSHLYEGIICGIEKSIISISIGIWREAQLEAHIFSHQGIIAIGTYQMLCSIKLWTVDHET